MRIKNLAYLLSMFLLTSGIVCGVGSSSVDSVSFHGVGVTIDMTFPEEAHPSDNITHNVTITADTPTTLRNFTAVVKALVNQSWVEIFNGQDTFGKPLPVIYSLQLQLPQEANGTLQCTIYVNTTKSLDYLNFALNTTQVRTLTYSELLTAYNGLTANYSALTRAYDELNANYSTLLITHNELIANYTALLTDYATLLGNYSTVLAQYNALSTVYNGLTSDYASLNTTYNLLLANYNNLSSTFNSLLAKNNALQSDYNSLNSTYYNLQANYNSLEGSYNSVLAKNNALQSDYNSLSSTDNALQTNYNSLLGTKNTLQSDYNSLNSTHYSVQASYDLLRGAYDTLNRTYTSLVTEISDLNQRIHNSENAMNSDRIVLSVFTIAVAGLVAFIIYIKRKKPEPYVVIRKETVTLKPEESPPT